MNKFITVTGTDRLTYSFNVAHIICVKRGAHGAIVYHTTMGHSSYVTVIESYEEIMNLLRQ